MTLGAGRVRVLGWIALLASIGAWGCGARLGSGPPGQPGSSARAGWLELETPHFRVHTDLPELQAREMGRSLEDARTALLASAWPGAKGPPGRTRVVVFTRLTDFHRYTGVEGNVAGIAITRPGFERWIAFSPGPDNGIPSVAAHELVHDLSQWFLPLQPRWLAEGLASYLEGFRFDAERRTVVAGESSPRYVGWLKQTKTLMSSSRLFAETALEAHDPREDVSFYAGAWFLVHYLLNERGEAFGQFQRSLMRLTPWKRAWEEAFPGLTLGELDADMIQYAEEGRFTPVIEPFEPSVFEPTLRTLSPAEAYGVRALLGAILGNDTRADIEAASKLEPDELSALVARFHSLESRDERARQEIARRAVAAHPDDGDAWLLAARVAPEGQEQRHALDRAFALAPYHPGVVWLLANDELRQGNPKRALELVRLAERRSGLSASMLMLHVGALLGLQRCDDAGRLAESGASLLAPTCQMVDPRQRRSVTCAEFVRTAYAAAEPSCNAAAQAANTTDADTSATTGAPRVQRR
jgi:hypothetical protein